MEIKCAFTKSFIEGFTKRCATSGLSEDEIASKFKVHANNVHLSQPDTFAGFSGALKQASLGTAKMARFLTPDMLALAVDCRVRYGDDMLSREMRKAAGFPEPSWETVPRHIVKTASVLSNILHDFDAMPLNQKVLLSAISGGTIGGAKRLMAPSNEDLGQERGAVNRTTRGILRGAGIGAGVGLGAGAGGGLAGPISPELRVPAMALGGTMGGLAGTRLVNDIIS